jgi:hypothetical protein
MITSSPCFHCAGVATLCPHNTITSALTMGGVRVQRTNKQIALVTEMVTDCG